MDLNPAACVVAVAHTFAGPENIHSTISAVWTGIGRWARAKDLKL